MLHDCCHEAINNEACHIYASLLPCTVGNKESSVSLRRAAKDCGHILSALPSYCGGQPSIDLQDHVHGPGCGHDRLQHGNHVDYLVPNLQGTSLEIHHTHTLPSGTHIDVHGVIDAVITSECSLLGKPKKNVATRSSPWRFRIDDMSSIFGRGPRHNHHAHARSTAAESAAETTSYESLLPRPPATSPVPEVIPVNQLKTGGDVDSTAIRVTRLRVASMCCDLEAKLIKKLIGHHPGLQSLRINTVGRLAVVKHDPHKLSIEEILVTLNAAQLGVSVQGTSGEDESDRDDGMPLVEMVRTVGSCLFFLAAITASLIEEDTHHSDVLFEYHVGVVAVLCMISVFIGFGPILIRTVLAARYGVIDVSTLMVAAVFGALLGGEWIEAAAVVAIFTLAEQLEDVCMRHVRDALAEATSLMPTTAVLAQPSKLGDKKAGETVSISSLQIGDVVAASPGDMIPVDGRVYKGGGSVDESSLTGEPMGVLKEQGSEVHGGTIVVNGFLEVEATAAASDSTLSQIETLIQDAQASESDIQRTVDRFAAW